jgi:hypothetical protein
MCRKGPLFVERLCQPCKSAQPPVCRMASRFGGGLPRLIVRAAGPENQAAVSIAVRIAARIASFISRNWTVPIVNIEVMSK